MIYYFTIVGCNFVCKIPLLARALGLKAKRARDDRVSCIQSAIRFRLVCKIPLLAGARR